jgi:WW domain
MRACQADTVEQLPVEHTWHVQEPFLVATHQATDIGLVGWNDVRWKHQDKTIPLQQGLPKHTWKQAFDPEAKRYYYYNFAIGATSWDAPASGYVPDDTVPYYVAAGIAGPCPDSATGSAAASHEASVPDKDAASDEGSSTADGDADDGAEAEAAVVSVEPAAARFCPRAKGELEGQVERYWIARYSLASRWATGACFDERSLYSVTPEVLAAHHAQVLRGATVLDAFCGCGGNAVQFARCAERVRMQRSRQCRSPLRVDHHA